MIVFAILLMILTLASTQFFPRLRDRVTQRTLGNFFGTFSYWIAAMPAARSLPKPFAWAAQLERLLANAPSRSAEEA